MHRTLRNVAMDTALRLAGEFLGIGTSLRPTAMKNNVSIGPRRPKRIASLHFVRPIIKLGSPIN
ncbi:MAG: hypothetical protein ACLQUZ_07825 [Rhizomicrobium sp.]